MCFGRFWVPKEEPPGFEFPTARRHMPISLSFLGSIELPGGDE